MQVGQRLTVAWRGKPVFIDHRTAEEIKAAETVNLSDLRDPQPDSARVKKPEWLVIVGVVAAAIAYDVIGDVFFGGRTVGKALMRLRVLHSTGRTPDLFV